VVANTHPHRSPRSSAESAGPLPSRRREPVRWGALLAAIVLLLGVSACGKDVQTNKPYTPSEGINLDVGDVAIRNVLIISRTRGSGIVSASLMSRQEPDSLTGVGGTAIKPDGSEGAPLTASLTAPVSIDNKLVVLTDQSLITVSSPDLAPGLTAQLVLTFARAGEVSIRVPVMDGNAPYYATISPSPAATASPSPAP
jgi:hypothetical protein